VAAVGLKQVSENVYEDPVIKLMTQCRCFTLTVKPAEFLECITEISKKAKILLLYKLQRNNQTTQ
jgi:hypothetical protein